MPTITDRETTDNPTTLGHDPASQRWCGCPACTDRRTRFHSPDWLDATLAAIEDDGDEHLDWRDYTPVWLPKLLYLLVEREYTDISIRIIARHCRAYGTCEGCRWVHSEDRAAVERALPTLGEGAWNRPEYDGRWVVTRIVDVKV